MEIVQVPVRSLSAWLACTVHIATVRHSCVQDGDSYVQDGDTDHHNPIYTPCSVRMSPENAHSLWDFIIIEDLMLL